MTHNEHLSGSGERNGTKEDKGKIHCRFWGWRKDTSWAEVMLNSEEIKSTAMLG